MNRRLSHLILAGAALLGTGTLNAADRALLIGIGQYADSNANLPGIDHDLEQMQTLARSLGFAEIATLKDQQATRDQVVAKIQRWLIQGTQAGDRVLLYFSGHGSRIPDDNGDEADGADDVLVMHDVQPARRNGRATLDGVLVDDQIGALLTQIPSRKVLFLVDACHSGTADKGLGAPRSVADQGAVQKVYSYAGIPAPAATKSVRLAVAPAPANYVMIAAAQDDEASIATPQGSLFTLAVAKAFGTGTPGQLTPQALARQAAAGVEGRFHPQLQGNLELAAAPIGQGPTRDDGGVAGSGGGEANTAAGPAWREIATAAGQMAPLTVSTNATRYAPGTLMEIAVEVPAAGYLNVLYVDERDQPTVMFPNAQRRDNRVAAGTLRIPDQTMGFELPAAGQGRNLIVAIWSATPTDLFAESSKGTGALFRTLSTTEATTYARAFDPRPSADTATLRAGQQVVEVCEDC